MKIFGKFGYFWYRNMDKIIVNQIVSFQDVNRRMSLFEVSNQVREGYSNMIKNKCEMNITRLELLKEYLKIRKEYQKENKLTWHEEM